LPAAKGKEEMAAEEERLQEEVAEKVDDAMVELGKIENVGFMRELVMDNEVG
jgi:hypothetical protein